MRQALIAKNKSTSVGVDVCGGGGGGVSLYLLLEGIKRNILTCGKPYGYIKKKIKLQYYSEIPPLGIYPKDPKTVQKRHLNIFWTLCITHSTNNFLSSYRHMMTWLTYNLSLSLLLSSAPKDFHKLLDSNQ